MSTERIGDKPAEKKLPSCRGVIDSESLGEQPLVMVRVFDGLACLDSDRFRSRTDSLIAAYAMIGCSNREIAQKLHFSTPNVRERLILVIFPSLRIHRRSALFRAGTTCDPPFVRVINPISESYMRAFIPDELRAADACTGDVTHAEAAATLGVKKRTLGTHLARMKARLPEVDRNANAALLGTIATMGCYLPPVQAGYEDGVAGLMLPSDSPPASPTACCRLDVG